MSLYLIRFNTKETEIIAEALSFVNERIEKFRTEKKMSTDKVHHHLIDEECDEKKQYIEFVKPYLGKIGPIDKDTYKTIMDIIRSTLEIYLQNTLKTKIKLGLTGFETKIQEIKKTVDLEQLKDAKTDLFVRYYETSFPTESGKIEVFFSYSHKDKALTGKIATLLSKKGTNIFLAHEDIKISEKWREEILKHLESSNIMVALLTPNFMKSVWTNQEAGFMMGKGSKIIPLIVEGTKIKKFGFIETLQGIPLKDENLENCVNKIVDLIFK